MSFFCFRINTTFAQLEIKDTNSSVIRRVIFDNTSSEPTPTFRLITSDGTKEIRQEVKPHEIRHFFTPKFSENRSRAGFANNRRKPLKAVTLPAKVTESSIVYVPPDKLEEFEKEIELDPDEEFQVEESNHGLYFFNYSDTKNTTQTPDVNITTTASTNIIKDNVTTIIATTTISNESKEVSTVKPDEEETNTIANSTDNRLEIENEKEKTNQTLFMSEEIYNHFRPLETEPGEDMTPFKNFGQKLGGATINDNLTNSPSLLASTKSVNYIGAPSDKRKFNSRYSATEKYRNTSADEEEVNEDMDVSVVKNVIEKNKIRNTVKGPAPARHVGLVNAYRQYSSTTPAIPKAPNIAQPNVTEPIVLNITPATNVINDGVNKSSNVGQEIVPKFVLSNSTKEASNKTPTTPAPRNFTRNYLNIRRKPANRVAASTINENVVPTVIVNTTTEKASTVYTAVVTSVSITSSVKGLNKTEPLVKDADTNTTIPEVSEKNETSTVESVKIAPEITATLKPTTSSTVQPSSSPRTYKHRIRIRTTTTENSYNSSPTVNPLSTSESPRHVAVRNETVSKISDRLLSLYGQSENTNTSNILSVGAPIRTKNILKRRRPTTTTSTTTTTPETNIYFETIPATHSPSTEKISPTQNIKTTEAYRPIITSRIAFESKSIPKAVPRDSRPTVNTTVLKEDPTSNNEEVVIEADKTYTASYVLAGLGFFPVAAIVAFVLRSVLNKKTKEIDTEYEGYFDDGSDIKKESPITPVTRPPLPTPSKPDPKWEFPRNKLRLQTLLGQGNFGQVS